MSRSREICTRVKAGSIYRKSRRPGRSQEDDGSFTVELRRYIYTVVDKSICRARNVKGFSGCLCFNLGALVSSNLSNN